MSNLRPNYFTADQKNAFNGQIQQEVIASGYSPEFGKLVAAQAKYESGNYSNDAFIDHNNICGYKYNGSKYQKGKGNAASDGGYYADYATIEDSVDELVAWFERREKAGNFTISNIKTPSDYVNALIADPTYYWFSNGNSRPTQSQINDYILGMSNIIQKIQFIYEENTMLFNGIGVSLILIGGFIYYYLKNYKRPS